MFSNSNKKKNKTEKIKKGISGVLFIFFYSLFN